TTTRAPSAGGGSVASNTVRAQTTRTETAATGSRRARKTVLPRLLSSAIWPSTHTRPRRPIHSPASRSTVRTGTGESALVSSGISEPPRDARPGLVLAAAELGDPALEHGQDRIPGLVRPLILHQNAKLGCVEIAQPGAQRGESELVVVAQRQASRRGSGSRGTSWRGGGPGSVRPGRRPEGPGQFLAGPDGGRSRLGDYDVRLRRSDTTVAYLCVGLGSRRFGLGRCGVRLGRCGLRPGSRCACRPGGLGGREPGVRQIRV